MFEHLDDKNPPQPRQLLVELVMAEGGRRRRRRAAAFAGGAAAVLALAGSLQLVQLRGNQENLKTADTPTSAPAPDHQSDNELSTTPGSTTTTAAGGNAGSGDEASAPPEATTFAGLTPDNRVVLGNAETGEIVKELARPTDDGGIPVCCVALSPDRRTVYYVTASRKTGTDPGDAKIYRIATTGSGTPVAVGTGWDPAISPDGKWLAYTRNSTQIVLNYMSTGQNQVMTGLPNREESIQDLAFTADSTSLIFSAAATEAPAELYGLYLDLSRVASLTDARQLGPPDGVPDGTGWYAPDARATDGTVGAVESCCALDAASYNADIALIAVDPGGGARRGSVPVSNVGAHILQAPYDPSGQNQLVLSVEDEAYVLSRVSDGQLEPLDSAAEYTAIDW